MPGSIQPSKASSACAHLRTRESALCANRMLIVWDCGVSTYRSPGMFWTVTVTADKLWSTTQDAIRQRVSPAHFEAWYQNIRLVDIEPVAAKPEPAANASTTPHHRPGLALLLAVGSNYAAQLIADELRGKLGRHAAAALAALESSPIDSPDQLCFRVLVRPDLFGAVAPVAVNSAAPAALIPATAPPIGSISSGAERTYKLSTTDGVFQVTLSSRFDLAEFVIAPENSFAHQGAKMVMERPGARFGTLFLHGPAGTGKTHLLQGACIDLHRRNPHLRVLYLGCEQWVNGYLEHTKNHRLDVFRRAVRSLDVLAIDDIQFLIGKKGSQREFLFMLESLLTNGKQVILASQLPPADMRALDARLLEKLYSSLLCPLEKASEGLREAIAGRRFERHATGISREALRLVGSRPSPSLHELEGRVNLLLAKSDGQAVGLNDCRRWLGGDATEDQAVLFPQRLRPVAIGRILESTAAFFHVRPEDIRGRRRSHSLLQARVVACKLARDLSGKSLQEIGKQIGDRSHATVLHCLRRFDVRRGVDPSLAQAYRHLHDDLTGMVPA